MSQEFLTTSAVARILQIADGTVRQMARRGELPTIRTEGGNHVRLFDRSTIERIGAERRARLATSHDDEAA